MIGIPSTTAAGAGGSLPIVGATAPAAGPPPVDQAFDEVFRQLTGGLLMTSAVAGEAVVDAEVDPAEADGDEGDMDTGLPIGTTALPVSFALPVEAAAPEAGAATREGEAIADGTAPGRGAADAATPGTTTRGGAASAPAAEAGGVFPGAVTAPAGAAVEAGDADDAAVNPPAEDAGTETPSTAVEANVRGLDRRRGMRETPARARTFDRHPSDAAAGEGEAPGTVEGRRGAADGPVETLPAAASAAPHALPASAERGFALHRALSRQSGDETAAPAGTTPAGQPPAAPAASDAAAPGGDQQSPGQRQGRAGHGAAPAGTFVAAAPAAAPAGGPLPTVAEGHDNAPSWPGPAAGAAWRAALAATALADTLGPAAAGTRPAGAPALAAAVAPALDLAALRDRGPMVDLSPAVPTLDHATAESVQAQIVKSIRLQWTGGLGEARVTLKPGYLGEVVASIKVDQGVVTATLHADTPEVRRWMESHTATLRDALVEHGLKLDRLTVAEPERHEAHGDRQSKPRQRPPDQQRPRARRQAADTDTPFDVNPE